MSLLKAGGGTTGTACGAIRGTRPLTRILVHMGLVRGLTGKKFDEVAEQIITTGRGGQANERA